ncbi:MAG: recombinase family protein [SAR324 cluster bacterium]|nr:recombinase family protein [SAR324 cluster bacterium]
MVRKVALYCRVSTSTKDQTTENQIRELKSYCDRMDYEIVKIYEDEVSGAKSRESRPAYSDLIKDAFLKRFDLIIGWDVSRFGRSMKEFVHFLSDMDEKGIGVIAVKNGLETFSSSGRMMMKLIGVLEEWNREMLVERTKSGLARTVANGTKLGRKSVLTPSIKRNILDAKENGLSIRKIADDVGINRGAVQRFLQVA